MIGEDVDESFGLKIIILTKGFSVIVRNNFSLKNFFPSPWIGLFNFRVSRAARRLRLSNFPWRAKEKRRFPFERSSLHSRWDSRSCIYIRPIVSSSLCLPLFLPALGPSLLNSPRFAFNAIFITSSHVVVVVIVVATALIYTIRPETSDRMIHHVCKVIGKHTVDILDLWHLCITHLDEQKHLYLKRFLRAIIIYPRALVTRPRNKSGRIM